MSLSPAGRAVLAFSLCVALMIPATAVASSYWSTLVLKFQLRGATRSYNGSSMNISMTASAPARTDGLTTFKVELKRDNPWPQADDYIGYSKFPRNGTKTARWSSVGSGNYYFFFSKANDGDTVKSDNVHMFN